MQKAKYTLQLSVLNRNGFFDPIHQIYNTKTKRQKKMVINKPIIRYAGIPENVPELLADIIAGTNITLTSLSTDSEGAVLTPFSHDLADTNAFQDVTDWENCNPDGKEVISDQKRVFYSKQVLEGKRIVRVTCKFIATQNIAEMRISYETLKNYLYCFFCQGLSRNMRSGIIPLPHTKAVFTTGRKRKAIAKKYYTCEKCLAALLGPNQINWEDVSRTKQLKLNSGCDSTDCE